MADSLSIEPVAADEPIVVIDPSIYTISDASSNREAVEELKAHFATVPRWELEKELGSGSYGAIVLIKKMHWSGRVERLAVKRAINTEGEIQLRNEIEWVKVRIADH